MIVLCTETKTLVFIDLANIVFEFLGNSHLVSYSFVKHTSYNAKIAFKIFIIYYN